MTHAKRQSGRQRYVSIKNRMKVIPKSKQTNQQKETLGLPRGFTLPPRCQFDAIPTKLQSWEHKAEGVLVPPERN